MKYYLKNILGQLCNQSQKDETQEGITIPIVILHVVSQPYCRNIGSLIIIQCKKNKVTTIMHPKKFPC